MSDLRARIRYSKEYPSVYIGHLDTVRELERSMRRAAWPFKLTSGFNPRVKMSSIPPLSLGYLSYAEYLEVSLNSIPGDCQIGEFETSQPEGLEIISVEIIYPGEESINDIIEGYRYRIEISQPLETKPDNPAVLREEGKGFLVIDILKKDGNIKNPAKFIDQRIFKKVVKTECIFKSKEKKQ